MESSKQSADGIYSGQINRCVDLTVKYLQSQTEGLDAPVSFKQFLYSDRRESGADEKKKGCLKNLVGVT